MNVSIHMEKRAKTMFTTIAMKRAALALLLASTVVGAAGAQTQNPPPDYSRACYCAGGLFSLPDGTAKFHVALDDDSSQPSVFVVMRFINQNGTVVKARTVTIAPGGSATLEYSGSGLYRMQAETFEPLISLSNRRAVVASGELFGSDKTRLIPPGPWIPCVFVTTHQ